MTLLFVIVLALTSSTVTEALSYDMLEDLGASCPSRDTCFNTGERNFSQMNCECDRQCKDFGDCCMNADAMIKDDMRRPVPKSVSCMPYGFEPNLAVYVTDKCSFMYRDSEIVRQKCEGYDDMRDPLFSLPVTQLATGKTYRNRYCAECNGASSAGLKSWLIYMDCGDPADLGVNASYVWQNVNHKPDMDSWVVDHDGKSHTCYFTFDKPIYFNSQVRECRPNLISTCPENSTYFLKTLCRIYMAVVYENDISYKNPHCALCNRRLDKVSCQKDDSNYRMGKKSSSSLLLDIDGSDSCPIGQMYDPFLKKCRILL